MSDNRKTAVICLVAALVLGVVYYFWGDDVLAFIGRTIIYWVGFFFFFIFLCNCVYCIVKDSDDLKGEALFGAFEGFFERLNKKENNAESKKEEKPFVSPEENEGEAIPPAEELNVEDDSTPQTDEKKDKAFPPAKSKKPESFF